MAVYDIIARLAISFLVVAINSMLLQYVSAKLSLEHQGFDKSTAIAFVIGCLVFLVSFLPRWGVLIMVLGGIILPFLLIKELYRIEWKRAARVWAEWLVLYLLVIAIIALILALVL